jgi:hypothetical protein
VRKRAERVAGPGMEDWKRNLNQTASIQTYQGG